MTTPKTDRLPAPWGEHALPGNETVSVTLGPLTVWLRSVGGEVWLAHAPGDWTRTARGRAAETTAAPAEEDWVRWPVSEGIGGIVLAPVFPPRPVVVEPELSFRLLPRAEARIFVRVPLWIRVSTTGEGGQKLADIPSVVLSDTWWGTPVEGELCYWLATTARRRVEYRVFAPQVAVCSLQLVNRSDDELPVEKIALRVAHLSIFVENDHFWSDVTRVTYRGADEGSDVQVTGRKPSEAPDATLVAGPQEPLPARGFRARSFAALKGIPGLAGL